MKDAKRIEPKNVPRPIGMAGLPLLLAAMMATGAGCAFKVIPPETVTVHRAPDGEPHTIRYPAQVIVHDDESFWDWHQIKFNLVGLTDLEAVRIVDILADILTPGPERRPAENAIEWVKNEYAKLPPYGPVKIVGELFWAIGLEKASYGRGIGFFPRIIYVTEWFQVSMDEMNSVAGFLLLNREALIPKKWTAAPNRGVDWTQSRALGLYIYLFQGLDWCTDKAIDGAEFAWQKTVWLAATSWWSLFEPKTIGKNGTFLQESERPTVVSQ